MYTFSLFQITAVSNLSFYAIDIFQICLCAVTDRLYPSKHYGF